MKILLDECVDRRLVRDLADHSVITVPRRGWAGIKNGDLLSRAESEFDVLTTIDSKMRFQQNVSKYRIALIVLEARSNRFVDTPR